MSRPRLDAERKKVSFSLAFSPNLIAALERVRGAKSQSVFVEEWLRQQPKIAAELVLMNDPGFTPPITRYERLLDLLLAFYTPGGSHQSRSLVRALYIGVKQIVASDLPTTDVSLEARIADAMEELWAQERRKRDVNVALGENVEAVRPVIQDYARYYVQTIFNEMAHGDARLLKQRFASLARGCEALYRERQRA